MIYLLQDIFFNILVDEKFLPAKEFFTWLLIGFIFQSLYFLVTNFFFYEKKTGILATFTEGISNAIIEYMVFEKPVIASDGGGTNELVIDGNNGFLVEQQNIEQLVEKIEYLLENPKIASEMGKKGRIRIEKHFSIDTMIKQTVKLYEKI
ncbi:MAG: glycosyltransferase [Flavobacteriaceae bacterium]|nr:glycosyltransferase [Flavobacteriaceae bacterium]